MKNNRFAKILFSLFFVVVVFAITKNSAPIFAADDETGFSTAIENVAQKVGPAVVCVKTEKIEYYRNQPMAYGGAPLNDDLLYQFFRDFFGDMPESEYKSKGLGSGVIINKDGYILTNAHVIKDADKISVLLPDGRELDATLKGTDVRSDLAIIKIDAPDLPFAELGDSDTLKIGQWVVAIGNPFGYMMSSPEPTVTAGVISALQRSLPRRNSMDISYSDLIQTDAAINPGNSGGPLVNLKGEVIGVNSAIFSTTGGYQGIGFAIPINDAKQIIARLIEGKEIEYGWIGVNIQDIDKSMATYFNLPVVEGVLVVKVLDDSPAQKAGIRDGDAILTIDGKKVKSSPSLIKLIATATIGKKVKVDIIRDKKPMSVDVLVEKRPNFDPFGRVIENDDDDNSVPSKNNPPKINSDSVQWRGMTVRQVPPEMVQQLNGETGVLVTEIERNSGAQAAGVRRGDVIKSINNLPVQSLTDFANVTKKAKGGALVRTLRGFVVVDEK